MCAKSKVLVIGGGPGGYVAAIKASQLGADVILVEKNKLGGTCLNVGCIPTKALLHASDYVRLASEAANCGIELSVNNICWDRVIARKEEIVNTLTAGVSNLLKRNNIRIIIGTASFIGINKVCISTAKGNEYIEPDKTIIATGSQPSFPPIDGLANSKYIINSSQALSMKRLPEEMVILGGGVIGVEFACALNAFGCRVTIIEICPRLIPSLDAEISQHLAMLLAKQGIRLYLNTKITRIIDGEDCADITVCTGDGEEKHINSKLILVALGRKPYTDGLNLETASIKTDNGHIVVDEYLRTTAPDVFAIGDCVGQIMLAHAASAQGECAAENAVGTRMHPYSAAAIPSCVYAFPEVSSVGLTEEQAREFGIPYHTGVFPLSANGRSLILANGKGMVKVVIGDELNEVLGVHIIGPNATEIIGEAAVAMEMEGTSEQIINTVHAHPSVSEALREAVLAAENRAIHMPNKRK